MDSSISVMGWMLFGAIVGAGIACFIVARQLQKSGISNRTMIVEAQGSDRSLVADLIEKHFSPIVTEALCVSERKFPFRVRVDLHRAIERLFGEDIRIAHFCGVTKEYNEDFRISDCLAKRPHDPVVSAPPEYEELDIGDKEPIRCLKTGLWLLESQQNKFVVLLVPAVSCGMASGIRFQIATTNDAGGTQIAQKFFRHLEDSVLQAKSYRGKVLSLEQSAFSYTGESSGITVHKLRTVERDQVILPRKTLDLLDRNVIQFVQQRKQLAKYRQATKKGLLFYGPPGTGKTHTIHYLAQTLQEHTTLLISAEQVGLLGEYMTLARLLQPSIVVMEDVDLIARERTQMSSPCEEVLLNKLLNEMDGLKEEADILFILTTNRPESLEVALASRPGRVDQAIEFPLPDDEGREKLVHLYSTGIRVPLEVVRTIVARTDQVSAAFIKELMRRSVQFHLGRNGTGQIDLQDVEDALEEMLFSGGSLNLKLLGAERNGETARCEPNKQAC